MADMLRGTLVDSRDEIAREAVAEFRKLQPTLSAYARLLTGRKDVRVEAATKDNGSTDGTRIFYRPPIALGEKIPHNRALCDLRDESYHKICPACKVREEIMVTIMHEIAHLAFDTFQRTSEIDKRLAIEFAIKESRSEYAERIKKRIQGAPKWKTQDFLNLASLVNGFLPLLVNALEDARVNALMFKARPGLERMFYADTVSIFENGFEAADGKGGVETVLWSKAPLNHQAIIGCFVKASGYKYEGWFYPDVEEALNDSQLTALTDQVVHAKTVSAIYNLSFKVLARLRELGFCGTPEDPDPSPPQPESEEEDEQDEKENSSSGTSEEASPDSEPSEGEEGSSEGPDEASEEGSGSGGSGEADSTDSNEGDNEDLEPDQDDSEEASGGGREGAGSEESTSESEGSGEDEVDGDDDLDYAESESEEPSDNGESNDPVSDSNNGDSEGSVPEEGEGDSAVDDGEPTDTSSMGDDESDSSSDPSGEDSGLDSTGMAGHDESSESDPSLESSEAQTDPDLPEDDDDDLIDTGADDGYGGTKTDERPAYGTPDDVKPLLQEWGQHDEKPKSHFGSDSDKDAVEKAIVQGIYFTHPSQEVFGVREHFIDKLTPESIGWTRIKTWDGSMADIEVADTVLQPAITAARRTFSDNRRGGADPNRKSGRVDSRVLGRRAWNNDERLFYKRTRPGKRSYFVVIGMDLSGSTIGRNIALEKRAVSAQAELLDRVGVPFAIYGHTGNYHDRYAGEGLDLEIYHIKDPQEPWNDKTRERLSRIAPCAANLDGHALEFLRKRAEESNATDTIVLYYSDGKMPQENHDEELEILQENIRICRAKGITLLGVGIRTDSPSRHGLDTVQVEEDSDITKVVEHLGKRLKEG